MGYTYVWLSEAQHNINQSTLILPKWHKLHLPKSNTIQGEILLSFYIFDKSHEDMIEKISFLPETTPYTCEINVLGLRQLKPLSILPVKKAYIKFDMNSLNVSGNEEDILQPIQTIPGDSGSDPTINTVFKFDARLPKEHIFIPQLQCEVFDHSLSGMIKSLLGIFNLDIKRIISKTNKQIDEDMKLTKKKFGLFLAGGMMMQKVTIPGQGLPGLGGLGNLKETVDEIGTVDGEKLNETESN